MYFNFKLLTIGSFARKQMVSCSNVSRFTLNRPIRFASLSFIVSLGK